MSELGEFVFCGDVDNVHVHVYENGEGLRVVRPGRAREQDEFDPEFIQRVFDTVTAFDELDKWMDS